MAVVIVGAVEDRLMGPAQLQLIDGVRSHAWTIGPDGARIGRGAPCEVAIASLQVSREHARIRVRDGVFLIEDLGSRNGTQVNGVRVRPGGQVLRDGDVVLLAGTVELTARMIEPSGSARVLVDLRSGEAWVGPIRVRPELPAAQLALLALLLRTRGQVVSHAAIVEAAWPGVSPASVTPPAVEQMITRIESRLRTAGWTGSLGTVTPTGGIRSTVFDELRREPAA